MSNLGPLTKTFTAPTSCAPTNAFSQIDGGFLFYLVQGAVETQACYPDKFNPSNQDYYSPAVCPAGYTAACSGVTSLGTATETIHTCCPSFGLSSGSFSCRKTIHTQFPWESSLACQYAITTPVTLAPLTSVGKGKTSTVTSSEYSGGAIGAYGVVVRNQQSDSAKITSAEAPANTGSSASSSSPKETGDNSTGGGSGKDHGLSSGAAAGVGVGCALAAVFVVAGGFLLWRRRSRQKKHSERPDDFFKAELAPEGDAQTTGASSPFNAAGKGALHTPTPPYSGTMMSQFPQELPATIPRQELPSNEAH